MAYSGKRVSLDGDVGWTANFLCPLESSTVGFGGFFLKILFAKLTIKSSCLSDCERSVVELNLFILYCVLPKILVFVACIKIEIKIAPDS